MNAGGSNATIDDFNSNWGFDRGPHNFIGGYNVSGGFNTVLRQHPTFGPLREWDGLWLTLPKPDDLIEP